MPIVNVPTAEQYSRAAKSAFFAGWNELFHLIADFERFFEDAAHGSPDWLDQRRQYYAHAKAEVETVCTLACQAAELALKAKICEVSPFLLLLGSDIKFKASITQVDFTDLRTIDAVDLIQTVNAVCSQQLSPQFAAKFDQFRQWRNKIMHQGTTAVALDPMDVARAMADQYAELWPQRDLIAEWLSYLSRTRSSFFHDHKWSTPHMELVEMYDAFFNTLADRQVTRVTGLQEKNTRRYVCHECVYAGSLDNSGFSQSEFMTCYLEDKSTLRCMACTGQFAVVRHDCHNDTCKGNVICASGLYEGMCHTCSGAQ